MGLTREARRWKRRHDRIVRAIASSGGVAKVKMQGPDGRWVFGVFLPYDERSRNLPRTPRLAPRRGRDGTTVDEKRRP